MNKITKLLIIVLCLLVLIAVAPLFGHGKRSPPAARYAVMTGKCLRPIAPHAGDRAWEGLQRAADHSPVIILITSDKTPSDEIKPGRK